MHFSIFQQYLQSLGWRLAVRYFIARSKRVARKYQRAFGGVYTTYTQYEGLPGLTFFLRPLIIQDGGAFIRLELMETAYTFIVEGNSTLMVYVGEADKSLTPYYLNLLDALCDVVEATLTGRNDQIRAALIVLRSTQLELQLNPS